MACYSCGRGFYEECISPDENGQPCGYSDTPVAEVVTTTSPITEGLVWQKDDGELLDTKSTGRKRAAKLYPLDKEAPCEWKGLKFAGGDEHPIIGCINGKQQARHHGPDKDTTNNSKGNVHRICVGCHNKWHTLNDPDYDWSAEERRPHDPDTLASDEDIVQNELFWITRKVKAVDSGKTVHD